MNSKKNLLMMLTACTLISCGKSGGDGPSGSAESSLVSEKQDSGGDLDRDTAKKPNRTKDI